MKTWTLEQAERELSEVVLLALAHHPQLVTLGPSGEDAVVVVSEKDYARLRPPRDLADFLRASPLAEAIAAGEFGDGGDPFARARDTKWGIGSGG